MPKGAPPQRDAIRTRIRVVVRVRPAIAEDVEAARDAAQYEECVEEDAARGTLQLKKPFFDTREFSLDTVLARDATQAQTYEVVGRPVVDDVLAGYNGTILAYGQTGTGKTYTMEGTAEAPGIIPRAIGDIFAHVERGQLEAPARKRFLLRTAYLQIYNDNVSDLLRPERTGLLIREDRKYATQCSNPRRADATDTPATHTLEPCLGQARPVRGEPLRVGGAPPVGSAAAVAQRLGGACHGSDARERGELTQPRRLHHSARAK